MRRTVPLRAAVSLLFLSAPLWAGGTHLTWTPPCRFTYENGSAYEKPLSAVECDWFKSSLGNNIKSTAQTFNGYKDLRSQVGVIDDNRKQADQDYAQYQSDLKSLLDQTDPEKIPCDKVPACAKAIIASRQKVESTCASLASPFLWPRYTDSYIFPSPEMKDRYYGDCDKRVQALNDKLNTVTQKMVGYQQKKVQEKLDNKSGVIGSTKGTADSLGKGSVGQDKAKLDQMFTGDKRTGATDPKDIAPKTGANAAAFSGVPQKPGAWTSLKGDADKAPPVLPQAEEQTDKRNYFARGYIEGAKRLKDDALIQGYHYVGYSQTVGDPSGAANNIVQQKGDSCGVGAVNQRMEALGDKTPIQTLAQESWKKGYYKETVDPSGNLQGTTYWSDMGKIAQDHGFKVNRIDQGTTQDLDKAVRNEGGAIVRTREATLWNNTNFPPDAGHFVYVTGLEQRTSDGQVLGYYVNDTGTGEGGRYVPADTMAKAFSGQILTIRS